MSFNGSGLFQINTAGQPVVTMTTITSTAFNALTADLANGLSTCITKDGQSTPTANIGLGGFKITNLANATLATDAVAFGQLSSFGVPGYTTTATAAGSTTLTVLSTYDQFFTGVTTQTVVLPVTGTLVLGFKFHIQNNSSGVVTVNSSGSNAVVAMVPLSSVIVTCILTSGTTAASWDIEYTGKSAVTGTGAFVLATSPTITTPVINSAAHVGGTWVADATWTLPAFTLSGTVTATGQEITSPVLSTAVAKGTWTTSGTWTLPAFTLGGTVALGGQTLSGSSTVSGTMTFSASPQLNNNVALNWKDSGGTARFALNVNASNQMVQGDGSVITAFIPFTTAAQDLGVTGTRWRTLFVGGVTAGTVSTTGSGTFGDTLQASSNLTVAGGVFSLSGATNTVAAAVATASTNKITINVGGTDYKFLVTTV